MTARTPDLCSSKATGQLHQERYNADVVYFDGVQQERGVIFNRHLIRKNAVRD